MDSKARVKVREKEWEMFGLHQVLEIISMDSKARARLKVREIARERCLVYTRL